MKKIFILFLIMIFGKIGWGQTYHLDMQLHLTPNDGNEVGAKPGTLNYLTSTNPFINNNNGDYIFNKWRFNHILIPAGAHITAASIEFYCSSTSYDDPKFWLMAEKNPNNQWFTSSTDYISSKTVTNASVSFTSTGIGTGFKAFSGIESVIQEMVDEPTWVYGWSHISIITKDLTNNARFAVYTYDWDAPTGSRAPKLHISWNGVAPPSNPTPAAEWQYWSGAISSASDGIVEEPIGTFFADGYARNWITNDSLDHYLLLRFTNITIQPGAIIQDASIVVTTAGISQAIDLILFGEASSNSLSFNDNLTISGRDITSASVHFWDSSATTGTQIFDHIHPVIQEVIDTAGWASGNAIAFIVQDYQSNYDYSSYMYDGSNKPALKIAYLAPTSTPTPTQTQIPTPTVTPVSTPTPARNRAFIFIP